MEAKEFVRKIKQSIIKKYDSDGTKVFTLVQIGSFFGLILSPNIAILTHSDEETGESFLYVCHPNFLEDYLEPLMKFSVREDGSSLLENHYDKEVAQSEFRKVSEIINKKAEEIQNRKKENK